MSQLFQNNAASVLASAATSGATTITVAAGASFPSPTAGDYFLATLIGLDANGNENLWEIVKCTSRTSNELVVVRAQEGTTARAWAQGTRIEARLTAASVVSPANIGTLAAQNANAVAITGGTASLASATVSGTASVGTLQFGSTPVSALGVSLITAANAGAQRTALGLGGSATLNVGTTAGTVAAGDHAHAALYQPLDSELMALASLTSAANKLPYFSGAGAAALADLTAAGRSLIAGADATAMRTTLGLGGSATLNVGTASGTVAAGDHAHASLYQPLDSELMALASLTSAANKLPYFSGAGTAAVADLTAAARSLLDDADVAAMRTTLGLGTAATTAATDYATAAQGAKADSALQAAAIGVTICSQTDPRLTDARTPTAHSHASTDITDSTSFGRSILIATNAASGRSSLGLGGAATLNVGTAAGTVAAGDHLHTGVYQSPSTTLTALGGLTTAANLLPYFTGSGTASTTTFTAFGRTLAACNDAYAGRYYLELGNAATLNTGTTAGTVAVGNHSHAAANLTDITFDGVTLLTSAVADSKLKAVGLRDSNGLNLLEGSSSAVYSASGSSVSPGNVSPATALVVRNNQTTDTSYATLELRSCNTAGSTGIGYISYITDVGAFTGAMAFGQRTSSTAWVERMRIASDGKLQINSATQLGFAAQLQVNGDIAAQGGIIILPTGATADVQLKLGLNRTGSGNTFIDLIGDTTNSTYGLRIIRNNTGANTTSAIIHRGTGNLQIEATDAANMVLNTAATTRLAILAGGNVVVGATADDASGAKLQVNGALNIRSTGLYYAGVKLLGARRTGWVAATGTATRTTFATSSVTLPLLAERVKALIDDLIAHGIIGA